MEVLKKFIKEHIRKKVLLEKVTKRDINFSLTDNNIQVGIEFEFYLDEEYAVGNFGNSVDEYDNYVTELTDWANSVSTDYDSFNNDWIISFNRLYEKLTLIGIDLYSSGEKEEDEDKSEIFLDAGSEVTDFVDSMNPDYPNGDDIENFVDNSYLDDIEEHLELAGYDVRAIYNEFDTGDGSDVYEFAHDGHYIPSFGSDIEDYWDNYVGNNPTDDIWMEWLIDDDIYSNGANIHDVIGRLSEEGFYSPDDGDGEAGSVSGVDWDNLDLPFDPSRAYIGPYHNSTDYKRWRIEDDGSLDSGFGVEIITPILDMQDAVKVIHEMLNWISEYGSTDSTCGLHINMSYKGQNDFKDANLLKLMLSIDEDWIWNEFPDRMNSTYAKSNYEKLKSRVFSDVNTMAKHISTTNLRALFNNFLTTSKNVTGGVLSMDRHMGVNITHSLEKNARIEFRYLGGSNYEDKEKDIIAQLGRYAYWLKSSFDNTNDKAYIKKFNRVYQKAIESSDSFIDVNRLSKSNMKSLDSMFKKLNIKKSHIRQNVSMKTLLTKIIASRNIKGITIWDIISLDNLHNVDPINSAFSDINLDVIIDVNKKYGKDGIVYIKSLLSH